MKTRIVVALSFALAGSAAPLQAQTRASVADSTRIVAVLAALDSAWHAGDADRWVAHYATGRDFVGFVNLSGMRMNDLPALRTRLAAIFSGIFRGSRHVGTLRRLQFLAPNTAVVDEDIEITGFAGLPAGISPTSPGVLQTRMRHVMVRRGNRWLIVASQNTAVAPAAPGPGR